MDQKEKLESFVQTIHTIIKGLNTLERKMVALVLQEMKVLEKQKGNIFISLIPMIQLLQMCLTNLFTVMKTRI